MNSATTSLEEVSLSDTLKNEFIKLFEVENTPLKKLLKDYDINYIDWINTVKVYTLSSFCNILEAPNKPINELPKKPGVYFICKNDNYTPNILASPFDISIKNKRNRTITWYDKSLLDKKCSNTKIVYIGKASSNLRTRIRQYIHFGNKNISSSNHAGGRAIWQIDNSNNFLLICWLEIPKASELESILISNYEKLYNSFPFANFRH